MMIAIRTAGDPSAMTTPVRQEIAKSAPNLPVLKIDTVDEQLADVLSQDRLIAGLAGFFGSVALLLAGLGMYGLVAYTTARRTSEIGLRLALGATRRRVLAMVIGESIWLAVAGILVGIPAMLAVTRFLASGAVRRIRPFRSLDAGGRAAGRCWRRGRRRPTAGAAGRPNRTDDCVALE